MLLLITSKGHKLIELNVVHNYPFHFKIKTVEKAVDYVVIFVVVVLFFFLRYFCVMSLSSTIKA